MVSVVGTSILKYGVFGI